MVSWSTKKVHSKPTFCLVQEDYCSGKTSHFPLWMLKQLGDSSGMNSSCTVQHCRRIRKATSLQLSNRGRELLISESQKLTRDKSLVNCCLTWNSDFYIIEWESSVYNIITPTSCYYIVYILSPETNTALALHVYLLVPILHCEQSSSTKKTWGNMHMLADTCWHIRAKGHWWISLWQVIDPSAKCE